MADLEKPEQDGMTETENPKNNKEGEDIMEKSSDEPKEAAEVAAEAEKKIVNLDDYDSEESEYSEDEYLKFVELYDKTLSDIKEGEIVLGRILAVNNQDVMIDIGFKSEGSVPLEEFGGD